MWGISNCSGGRVGSFPRTASGGLGSAVFDQLAAGLFDQMPPDRRCGAKRSGTRSARIRPITVDAATGLQMPSLTSRRLRPCQMFDAVRKYGPRSPDTTINPP